MESKCDAPENVEEHPFSILRGLAGKVEYYFCHTEFDLEPQQFDYLQGVYIHEYSILPKRFLMIMLSGKYI